MKRGEDKPVRTTIKMYIMMLTLCLVFSAFSFADEVEMPYPINEKKFLKECNKQGLDLYGNDKSQGFLQPKGGKNSVFSYHPLTEKQLEIIKDAWGKSMRYKNE